MTQQKQFFKAAAWLVGAILLTACTHDADLDGGNHQAHEWLQFNLSFAQFNADKEAVNGAKAKVRAVSAPQTIDLGNGLELEMTAERDAPEPSTRTTPLYDGHYTILAIDNAGNRVGKIKGTVTSGNFTRDEDEKLDLFDGQQYTFVCFNSAVTDDGTNLKFDDLNLHPAEQDMPLIGRVTWTVHPGQNFIPFEMKRQVGRVRFKLTTYTADAQNAKINLTTVHWHNRKAMYNPGTKAYAGEGGAGSGYAPIDENPVYGASGVAYDAMVKAHEQTTPYYYFLGNDVAGAGFIIGDSYLQFTSGTAYGKALPTTKYHIGTIFNTHDNFTANSSYTFNIKVKSKSFLLLFQDGTVGYYGDRTATRQPIGLVTKEKTKTSDGSAMALDQVIDQETSTPEVQATRQIVFVEIPKGSGYYKTFKTWIEYLNNDGLSGYDLTWDAHTDVDGRVKANEQTKYPLFYAVAHYNPGVTTSNIGRWFFPSVREGIEFFRYFGYAGDFDEDGSMKLKLEMSTANKIRQFFTDMGKTAPELFGTSTEYDSGHFWRFYFLWGFRPYNNTAVTYPFVHF